MKNKYTKKSKKEFPSQQVQARIDDYFQHLQQGGAQPPADFGKEEVFTRINRTLAKRKVSGSIKRLIPYAACIAILSIFALYKFIPIPGSQAVETVMLKRAALPGQKLKVQFEDGTEVLLNAGSTLIYPKHFTSARRAVSLEGEAYFDVKHDKKRPFLIYSNGTVTQVLGTSFNISSHKNRGKTRVTVISGRVAVYTQPEAKQKPQNIVFLNASQQTVYANHQFSKAQTLARANDAVAWKTGNLIFDQTSVREVVEEIERQHDVKIQVADNEGCLITVNFNKEPLAKTLRILTSVLDARLIYKDGAYIISDIHCN